MRITLLAMILLAVGAPGFAQSVGEIEMPEPPEGFTWQILPEIKAAFLRPAGWYFLAEEQSGTRAYFITKQDIAADTVFTVGLSINVRYHVEERTGTPVRAYAQSFFRGLVRVPGVSILSAWDGTQGPLQTYGVRYKSVKEDASVVIIHQIVIANTNTNTFYLIWFEAPEAEWETEWPTGEKLMQMFALDQGI